MSETITYLQNGGYIKRKQHRDRGFTETSYHKNPIEQEFISEKKAKQLQSTYGVKSVKQVSGDTCPPDDQYGRTVPQKTKDGKTICISPKIKFEFMKLHKKRDIENKKRIEKYLEQNNLTEYVGPYMVDQTQRSLLSFLLGKRNVDDIMLLNALEYSGILNNSCPAPGEPNKTEGYINPISGKMECREPIPKRTLLSGVRSCPEKDENNNVIGDPYATAHYIDYFGRGSCNRPILSGAFSCPSSGDPKKTKLVVLKNNVGICVEDPAMTSVKDKVMIPSNLVYPDNVNSRLTNFMRIALMNNFTMSSVKRINNILKGGKSVSELSMGLSGDPFYEEIMAIVNNIKKDEDILIARAGLTEYAKSLPEFSQEITSIDDMLKLNGIDMNALKAK